MIPRALPFFTRGTSIFITTTTNNLQRIQPTQIKLQTLVQVASPTRTLAVAASSTSTSMSKSVIQTKNIIPHHGTTKTTTTTTTTTITRMSSSSPSNSDKGEQPIIATADLCDDHVSSPQRLSIVQPNLFYSFGKKTSFYGQIHTVRCFESNPLVRETLEKEGGGNGKVLVVDGGGSKRCAILGDMLASFAVKNGWAGLIINGCIRDSKVINELDIGVKALGTHPLKSIKEYRGESNGRVTFGGVEFVPGHWVYSDEDGIIISEKELDLPTSKL